MQSPETGPVEKVAATDEKIQNKTERSQDSGLMPKERTPIPSSRTANTGRKKQALVSEPENQTALSTAFDFISSPVKYITSVFTQSAVEPPKSPPKLKFKYPEAPKTSKVSKTPKPVKMHPVVTPTSSDPNNPLKNLQPKKSSMDPIEVIRIDLAQNIDNKEKAPAEKTAKKSDPNRSRTHLIRSSPKQQENVHKRAGGPSKKHSPSPNRNSQVAPPRILSASNIRVASSNNISYRVTSADKVDSPVKPKKTIKKIFKIDKEKFPQ